jgi:hypothetical protein
VLFAPVRGNGPVWTTAFARYGLMMCGPADHPVATRLSSRWRFFLSSTQLDATEHITLAPICRASPLEIEWLAHPLALPSRPATQAGAPHRS